MDNASDPDRTPKEIHVAARNGDAERLRALISNRADPDATYVDHFDAWGNLIEDPHFQEPPMTPDRADADSPYLAKVLAAGSYKAYEKAHLKRLVDMFLPKFPDLPAEIIPNIVRHWGHVGYY